MGLRHFLFLQGPHGPFFGLLAQRLAALGHRVSRIGVNAGDAAAWPERDSFVRLSDPMDAWRGRIAEFCAREGVSDIVLYGDARPIHTVAAAVSCAAGIRLHHFEEGYIRPYWITYERGGVNGRSPLMRISMDRILEARGMPRLDSGTPDRWGSTLGHAVSGLRYHADVVWGRRAYPHYAPHRGISVEREFALNLRRVAAMPVHAVTRRIAERRLRAAADPYHMALLQLSHDSALREHSHFRSLHEVMETIVSAFAAGAPRGHRLVFKTHPFEDGREPLRRICRSLSARYGIADRVHLFHGGKLATTLDDAQSVVTVNSTAAHQALWRGIPVLALGRAVYAKPGIVSGRRIEDFFAEPDNPDLGLYRTLRDFMLATSQVRGSFYSRAGRAALLDAVPALLLAPRDRYAIAFDDCRPADAIPDAPSDVSLRIAG